MRANIKTKFTQSSNKSFLFSGMKVTHSNGKRKFNPIFIRKANFDSSYLEYWVTDDKRCVLPCASEEEALRVIREAKVNQVLIYTGELL